MTSALAFDDDALEEPPAVSPPAARPTTTRDLVGFVAMIFGMFMAVLDTQIVASSIHQIQAGVSASLDEINWVQTAYLIAEIVMIPLSGFLARALSSRLLFVLSCAGFTLTSLLCAQATTLESLVLFRVIQGFVGGAMIPTAFAVGYRLYPPATSAMVATMIGLVATMAPTLGPTIGGFITETYSWRWLFYVNLLPGIAVTTAVWFTIDVDKPDFALLRRFDFIGLVLLALFLGGLEYVLDEGPRWDWFSDTTIRDAAVVSAISAVLFFWRTLSIEIPVVELHAFRDRNFAVGSLVQSVIGAGVFGGTYLLPLYLGTVRNYNALEIGETMFVGGAFYFLAAPIGARAARILDPRVQIILGLAMAVLGLYLNSILTSETAFYDLFLPQALRSTGIMLAMIPASNLALGTLPPHQLNDASGLFNLTRNLGGAIALAAINTIITERGALHLSRLSDHLTLSRPGVQSFIDNLSDRMSGAMSGNSDLAATAMLSRLLHREANIQTFSDSFLLVGIVFVLAIPFIPLLRKPQGTASAAPSH